MTAADRYLDAAAAAVDALRAQATEIESAAELIAASLAQGGVVHVAGSGHSQLVAHEIAARAGGLAAVQPVADPALSPAAGSAASHLERLEGYAEIVLEISDCRPGEVLVVVSNSGINAVPVELALGGRARGVTVVAVTSLLHARRTASRHPSGAHLHEVADLVLDTGAPFGDVAIEVGTTPLGPLSTALGMTLIHAVLCRAAELLVERGFPVPALISQNRDAGPDINAEVVARYRDRQRWTR